METLGIVLPIIIYILLIVLLVVGIILGIKLIITIDKVNNVVDNVTEKVESLNGIFNIINVASNKMNYLTNKIIDNVMSFFQKIINLKSRKEDEEDE